MSENTLTYCVNHPATETTLRCKKCDSYICPHCAIRTPTGYQCKNCTRAQQKAFETALWYDYITAFVVSGLASSFASFLVGLAGSVPFFGLMIVLGIAPTMGATIAAVILRVLQRRRSQKLFILVAATVALAGLPLLLLNILIFNIWGIIDHIVYLVLVVPTVYYRISGRPLFNRF